jgi:hypothetical protein
MFSIFTYLLDFGTSVAMEHNGSRLCVGGDLKYKSFNSALKPIRITAVDVSTSVPLAQNRC